MADSEGHAKAPETLEEAKKASLCSEVFSEDDFKQAALDFCKMNLEGYEFFLETMNIKFYRKYQKVS